MFVRKDVGAPNGGVPAPTGRDGSHCDLCGCSTPAVRCDKCNRQVFCLSCDDMYHRHPRRKSHLRRAVDSVAGNRAPASAARAAAAPTTARFEGDPSHMPVPPPRKKKSLFSAFSRGGSHQAELERHPALPKKEFSWTDKFGSIKRFMASRPLPPVPPEDEGMPSSPLCRRDHLPTNYVNVDPNPPAVPQRPPPRLAYSPRSRERREFLQMPVVASRNERMTSLDDWEDVPSASGSTRESDESWGPEGYGPGDAREAAALGRGVPQGTQPGFGTLRKHNSTHGFAGHPSGDGGPLGRPMQQSSSMSDLHHTTVQGLPPQQLPQGYPQHFGPTFGPAFGPTYRTPPAFGYPIPYAMAPGAQLQYYRSPAAFLGSTGSWSNVNSAAEDGKETDDETHKSQRHSTLDSRRIKRSQSFMHDPIVHPGPFYPFGYPQYPPFFPPWMRPPSGPPSPSPSQQSLPVAELSERLPRRPDEPRPHHRKHKKSVAKTSRRQSSQDFSSEEQDNEGALSSASNTEYNQDSSTVKTKSRARTGSLPQANIPAAAVEREPNRTATTPSRKEATAATATNFPRIEHSETNDRLESRLNGNASECPKPTVASQASGDGNQASQGTKSTHTPEAERPKWDPTKPWRCEHCTFINEPGSRICLICCKTTFRDESPAPPSDDESQRQKKRTDFQDTLADKDIEVVTNGTAAGPASVQGTEQKPQQKTEPVSTEGKSADSQTPFSDDFIKEQQEVEKEIRRRLEIQMRIDEENRKLEGTVEETKTVQHFQADSAETESSSVPPQVLLQTPTTAAADTLHATPKPVAEAGSTDQTTIYRSTVQQSHSSSQTVTSDEIKMREVSPTQTTPAEVTQAVRPKVLYKASVGTDTEDFVDSTSSDTQQPQDKRRRTFAGAKSQSLDQPRPPASLGKVGQQAPRGTRISNLIRTLSKTSLQHTEPEGVLYRSNSRSSLHSELSDTSHVRRGIARHGSLAEFDRPFPSGSSRKDDDSSSVAGGTSSGYLCEGRKQDYYLSLEELVQQRRQEQMRTQGLELVRLIREAEQRGFTADDLQVAMNHCGNDNPINWLRDNWRHMTETVVTLATNYGHDRRDNTIGIVSVSEAQNALRRQKGNIWAAVTECVENRQRMFMELSSRGTFSREEILTALTDNHGNMDMAYAQLTKATLKPFLMRIWGPGTGVDNDEGAQPTLPSPLDSKSDDSVTKRVKDWLESLDASQVPAYRLEAGDGRTQNRHSFHGTRTKDIVGERGRSSSPASSFSSQREASDVSSVSSMTQTTSSRLEAILQRREAQKVYERGRKSKKEVHTDRKRRWTLASVFDGKKIASVVKKDTFDNVESKCQTLTSVTTLASDTTPLDSSSSGATKSSETLASVEATGAKPKTFLGRLSSFRKDSNKKEVSTFEPHAIESSSSAMNGTGSNTTVSTETVKEAAVTSQPTEVQNIPPTVVPSAARKEGFLSKLLNAKQKSNERERTNEGVSITPGLSQTAGTPALKEASETADDSHNRNSIENIKQSIHAAKISFMTSPPVPVVQPGPQKPSISAVEATQSKTFVHNSNNGSSLERHCNPAPASDIPKTPKVVQKSPKLQNARGAESPRSTNLEKVKAPSSIKPQLNKSETRIQDTPAETLLPQEKQGALKARIASMSLNKSSFRAPNQGESNTKKSKESTEGPEDDGGSSEVATVPRTPSSPDSKQTRQLIDKENIVSTATFTPDASTTTSQKVESPSSSVQALMATQNNDAATTGPPVVVLDRRLSPKEREVEGSAKIDAQEPRHSYDALTQSSSPADKVEVVVSEAETPDEIAPPTTSQQEGQVTRRSRPSRQQDDEATNTTVPRRQGRRLSDTTAPRRRERPQPEGTTSTEMSRTDSLTVEPSTATGKGLYRRPSLRRPSRSGENGEDSAVRGPDGSVIIVKPQKPMERRSSVNARPGLHISRAVAANIAKLRSVPPPKKRKQVVQPRPAGKLPTEKQTQYKVKAEELVQDGKCPSMVHAQLVAELIDMSFDEEDAIVAAEQCDSIYQAVNFLQQECELCAANYPISQMVSLLNCVHRACNECLRAYFTIQIRDRNIAELLCPFCNEPDLGDEDVELNYFNNLDVLLKNLVEQDVYDLFQQKLRDRALMKDPNFRWCSQCSSGFITYPDQKRLVCPDCRAVTCAFCRKPWQKQHEGISCEQFQEWQEDNDPESQAEGIARYLSDNGIDCPNCKFKYALARGGCMHFKCYQCGFDFCCGCNQPFKMGEKCGWSPICAKLGLHAHHPRNCLFYLRDKDINELQNLLEEKAVAFNKDPPAHWEKTSKCQVPEQKETSEGLRDDICGKCVEAGMAGLCRTHYIEYLGQLIFRHRIDPLPIFDVDELELVLKRANIRLPSRYKLSDRQYQDALIKIIEKDVPLERSAGKS